MSVDYSAQIVYGLRYDGLFVPHEGDGYDTDAYWDWMDTFVHPNNSYMDVKDTDGIIGVRIMDTTENLPIDFSSIKIDTSDEEIETAYMVLTGKVPDTKPKMFLQLQVW